MKKDINWDDYYDGYSPFEKEEIPEDSILHIEYDVDNIEYFDDIRYFGPKTNATVKQIISYLNVRQHNSKFLYNNNTIVILLDYTEEVIDKWKNGTVLYCNGDKKYKVKNDKTNLSLIDQMLFHSGSSGEFRVYAFWKDSETNYNFINGILALNSEPYQIEESDGYRWIFPLSLISKYVFSMPEKYSFHIDIRRVNKDFLQENQKQDEIQLVEINNTEIIELFGDKPIYAGIPRAKSTSLHKREIAERNKKVVVNALQIADFKCEFDNNHNTFMRRGKNVQYTEAHHLIPLAYSELFKYSLDIEENIVSLCSNCHNQIHYGEGSEIIIKKLFASRKELLRKAGIILTEKELLSMYGIYDEKN